MSTSVVIPTYNRPEFLPGAIETALNQTSVPEEVIIVDDGSEEAYAGSTVEEYGPRIRAVTHETNRGLSAARNTGIEESMGEFVAFLDDDDRWHPTKLERQIEAMRARDAGIGSCLVASVAPDGRLLRCERDRPEGDLADEILRENVVGTPSRVVVRRDVLDSDRPFDEELETKQDWDLFIRLCQRATVALAPAHLCVRTVHDSMSSEPGAAAADNRAVMEKHRSLIRERGQWRRAEAAYHRRVGRAHLESDELTEAREHLERALRLDPGVWPGVVYALTYTTPGIFERLLGVKRAVERRLVTCDPPPEAS